MFAKFVITLVNLVQVYLLTNAIAANKTLIDKLIILCVNA